MSGTEDTTKPPFRDAAVAAAREFWTQGVSEARRGSTAPIAKDSGWNKYGDLRAPDGSVTDWCGMFVAASYYRAGLCAALRRGFFHVANVEHYFTYAYESRVPRWVWDAAAEDWRSLRDYHAERGSSRAWIDRDAVAHTDLAALDIRPGDVALIDHEGDGKANHITLVESYDPATGALVTLEGNGRGKVVTALNPDGSVVEGDAKSDAAVRNLRDLADPARRKKIYGVGRLSDVDVDDLVYAHSDRKPAKPPEAARVAVASAQPDVPRGFEDGTGGGKVVVEDGREGPKKIDPRKWNEPPEPVPLWLDPAAEVTEETGPRPAPRGPFVVAAMKACLALDCDPAQAAGVVANSINETGWGRSYRAYNCGGWKITPRYVKGFKAAHPNESPRWWRAPGNRTSGDPPWCYYRAFPSFEAYFEEWIAHFVPRPGESAPYPAYTRAGELFWSGEDWFPALISAGYKGSVTKAKPERSIREHDALVVTALRMWAQSSLSITVDGVWGKVSRATLAEWQKAHGLAETGSLDDATLAALAGDGARSDGALESHTAPIDEGWSEWALDDLAPEAEGADGEGSPDVIDALLDAWKRRPPASRRAFALRLIELLGSDGAEEAF